MPNLRTSSLPSFPYGQRSPYRDWIALAQTEEEWLRLLKIFHGLPSTWIEWVELEVQRLASRTTIHDPLGYRLTVLRNGIILLQEGKFICDWTEHALRQGFLNHMAEHDVDYVALQPTIPNNPLHETYWTSLKEDTENRVQHASALVSSFTFYELTETMARNWKRIENTPQSSPGFKNLFMSVSECRNVNRFAQDMKLVRLMRNDIAHAKRLLKKHEIEATYDTVCRWLAPLDVDLSVRIQDYRQMRPKFLDDLGLPFSS